MCTVIVTVVLLLKAKQQALEHQLRLAKEAWAKQFKEVAAHCTLSKIPTT